MKYSIGTTYEGKNPSYLSKVLAHVNHIEVSPDSISARKGGETKIHKKILEQLQWVADRNPVDILIHGVGLSIGSYDNWNAAYIQLLEELFRAIPSIKWHSEHLAYTQVNGENIGTMLTLPRTDEVLDLICERVDRMQAIFDKPFLLENVASMLPDANSSYTEASFLNTIVERTGCGLILDIYNLECDAYNFGFDIDPFLEELNLDAVYEIHVAGGTVDTEYDFKMDVHSRVLSESTLMLTERVIKEEPKNLQAITYEILEEFVDGIGAARIINELATLRKLCVEYAT